MRVFNVTSSNRLVCIQWLLLILDCSLCFESDGSIILLIVICFFQIIHMNKLAVHRIVSLSPLDGYVWMLHCHQGRSLRATIDNQSQVYTNVMWLSFTSDEGLNYSCYLWRDSLQERDWVVLRYYLKCYRYHRPFAAY